ncbi:hypothetical protein H5410_005004 [Solanum commersonii]|uniref:Uncharacterized protein n=1 Tax=Solanum commersonii TaxID=4109 RepID=A0A9J6A5Z3_SOLCO|nr:hypothetical protein H5410_005004 [Solanum commersonii]
MSTHSLGHQSSGFGRRMEMTHFQLREDEILLSSSLLKTLSKLERKYPKKSSRSGPLGGIVLLHGIIQRSADCSFHSLFDPFPSRLRILEQRAEFVHLATRQVFCSFLRLSIHASAKISNT